MSENILVRLFEHNNWANDKMIQACAALTDAQLDASPVSATKGTIRVTLTHLVAAQNGYLSTLTLPVDQRVRINPAFGELQAAARKSGEALLAVARDLPEATFSARRETRDGFMVEPWVIMVQIINHATEHREQVSSMLTALGVTPPELDGWAYGEATKAFAPKSK